MKTVMKSRLALSILFVSLMATLTVGCGSSRGEYVHDFDPNHGELVFQFERPDVTARTTVPSTTEALRFNFYPTSFPGDMLSFPGDMFSFSETQAYADEVRIRVATDVRSVIVTALGADEQPLAYYFGQFNVQVQQSIVVELVEFDPDELVELSVTADPTELDRGTTTEIDFIGTIANTLTGDIILLDNDDMDFTLLLGTPTGIAIDDNGAITVEEDVDLGETGTFGVAATFELEGETYDLGTVTFTVRDAEDNDNGDDNAEDNDEDNGEDNGEDVV